MFVPRARLTTYLAFKDIYKISSYFGIFPLMIDEGGVKIRYDSFLVFAIFLSCFIVISATHTLHYLDLMMGKAKTFPLVYVVPHIFYISLLGVNILNIVLKKKKIQKLVKSVSDVEHATLHSTPYISKIPQITLTVAMMIGLGLEMIIKKMGISVFMVFIALIMIGTSEMAISNQFTSVICIINSHFEHLNKHLDRENAETFVECHERLAECCEWLCSCYSPQLIIIYLIFAFYVVIDGYVVAVTFMNSYFDYMNFTVHLCWTCVDIGILFYVITSCSNAVSKAKKFDRLLYHLVINDATGRLLKNKRIMLHFKAKHKVEFSALGFFNFDYPLLCSIISTATTYIVILVQFSKQ